MAYITRLSINDALTASRYEYYESYIIFTMDLLWSIIALVLTGTLIY